MSMVPGDLALGQDERRVLIKNHGRVLASQDPEAATAHLQALRSPCWVRLSAVQGPERESHYRFRVRASAEVRFGVRQSDCPVKVVWYQDPSGPRCWGQGRSRKSSRCGCEEVGVYRVGKWDSEGVLPRPVLVMTVFIRTPWAPGSTTSPCMAPSWASINDHQTRGRGVSTPRGGQTH